VNRLWRLLHHLFGEPPPPRPTGHVPDRLHRGHHRHRHGGEAGEEMPDDDGPGPGPAPDHHTHHGH
jgi:hypothetical protein